MPNHPEGYYTNAQDTLAYDSSVHELKDLKEHAIAQFRRLFDSMSASNGNVEEENGYRLELLPEPTAHDKYRFDTPNDSYFIKISESESPHRMQGGVREFVSTKEAKAKLDTLPFVEVHEGLIAAEHVPGKNRSGEKVYRTYIVYSWNEKITTLPTVKEYLQGLLEQGKTNPTGLLMQKAQNVEGKLTLIQQALSNYLSVDSSNMCYDEVNDKIILFDLNKKDVGESDSIN